MPPWKMATQTVDVEEKRYQEQHNVFILTDIFNGVAQAHKAFLNRVGYMSHRKFLLVAFEQRHGHEHPPHCGDDKGNGRCQLGADADAASKEYQEHTGREGNTAADVAKGVAHAGDLIHAVIGGDVSEHGIAENKAAVIADFGDHKHDEK